MNKCRPPLVDFLTVVVVAGLAVDVEGIQFAIVYGGSDNLNSCLEFSSAKEILGFEPRDHVADRLDELKTEVIAQNEATVWAVRSQGTGHTMVGDDPPREG